GRRPRRAGQAGRRAAQRPAGLSGAPAAGEPPADHPPLRRLGPRHRRTGRPGWPQRSGGLRPDQAHQVGAARLRGAPADPGGLVVSAHPDAERLQAYLDGELPGDEAAAVEARLKAEPELAEALVVLARDEAVIREWAAAEAIQTQLG